jgi:hypothetical protein
MYPLDSQSHDLKELPERSSKGRRCRNRTNLRNVGNSGTGLCRSSARISLRLRTIEAGSMRDVLVLICQGLDLDY